MSEVKYTPGPWFFDGSDIYAETSVGLMSLAEIARTGAEFTTKEENANAKLIAAAPQLLEACINVNKWLMRDFDDGDASNDGLNPEFRKALETVRAAIKSATE